jgi:hypothetical protein
MLAQREAFEAKLELQGPTNNLMQHGVQPKYTGSTKNGSLICRDL